MPRIPNIPYTIREIPEKLKYTKSSNITVEINTLRKSVLSASGSVKASGAATTLKKKNPTKINGR